MRSNTNIYTVSQITNHIKNLIDEDSCCSFLTVTGEISNAKYHSSGHIYFTLKDKNAVLKCVMFASNRDGLKFRLQDGQQVEASGRIGVYPAGGAYQLYASRIVPCGDGELYARFLEIKARLEEEGLFAPEYKFEIPRYIKRLGVVTAATGAAVRDIINVASRRNPYVQIVLYPAIVQGEAAPASIIKGLEALANSGVDVIIAGRGGGSIEDLWGFNDEAVARAIFNCPVPVISAVGHETDFTIADFVADLRAPTPSAAAELAVFEYESFAERLDAYRAELTDVMYDVTSDYRRAVSAYKKELQFRGPASQVNVMRQRLDGLTDRLEAAIMASIAIHKNKLQPAGRALSEGMLRTLHQFTSQVKPHKRELLYAMQDKLTQQKNRLQLRCERLSGLSPLNRIADGYGYLAASNGKRICSVQDAQVGEAMRIYLSDGCIGARVEHIESKSFKTEGHNNGD